MLKREPNAELNEYFYVTGFVGSFVHNCSKQIRATNPVTKKAYMPKSIQVVNGPLNNVYPDETFRRVEGFHLLILFAYQGRYETRYTEILKKFPTP